MTRIKRLGVALTVGILAFSGLAAPSYASIEKPPVAGAGEVINPDGKVVKKLPPLDNAAGKKGTPNTAKPVKGMPVAGSAKVKIAKPSGKISTLADPACTSSPNGACYFYNGGIQTGFTANYGASAIVKIGGHSGALNGATDYHTLIEEAVQSADGQQIVEVGVTQDFLVNGVYTPRAFVGAWINGVFQGYNGGGFVPVSGASIVPGVTNLSANTNYAHHIWYDTAQDAWWTGLGSAWLGYFPGSLWTGATPSVTFNRNERTQIFWELASTEEKPCSDLGNGDIPTATLGSEVNTIRFRGVTNGAIITGVNFSTYRVADPSPSANVSSPYANTYSLGPAGAQTAYKGGGPMWNAAGTGVGSKGQPC